MPLIGINWSHGANKNGDKLCNTSLPENYYKNTGDKLIDLDNNEFFKFNPYVIHAADIHPNTLSRVERRSLWDYSIGNIDVFHCKTMAHQICKKWGLEKCYLNSPRLYQFENSYIYPKTLVINTTGTTQGTIPLFVLNHIREVYKDYLTFQIGNKNDVDAGADLDRRGCTWLESAKIISESEIIITVDSFCYWLAKCFGKVKRKIILINKSEERCENFFPRGSDHKDNPFDTWIEMDGSEFFNVFQDDYGVTKSYLSI